MNIKHAKDLRATALRWMAQVINDTPAGMVPDVRAVQESASKMCTMIAELWPKLSAKQRGKIGLQLELQRTAGAVRTVGGGYKYKDLNAIARCVVSMTEGK